MEYIILATFVIVLIIGVLLFFYVSSTLQARRVKPSFRVLSPQEVRKQLDKYIYEHQRYRSQFGVLIVLLEGASSELVEKLAEHIRNQVRLIDEVGLWKKEGLLFVMPHTPLKGASAMGSRIEIELSDQLGKIGAETMARKLVIKVFNFPRDREEIEKLAKGKPVALSAK